MRLLRRYIFLGVLNVFTLSAHSQMTELISPIIEQDGRYIDVCEIIELPEPLRFSLIDSSIQGEWQVSFINKDGNLQTVGLDSVEKGSCVFNPDKVDWKYAKTFYNEEFNRNLYKLIISFLSIEKVKCEKTLFLAFLPEIPRLSSISFTYIYNWDYDDIYPNGDFKFFVTSKGASGFELHYTESFLFEVNNPFFKFSRYIQEADSVEIHHDADWGEYIIVSAYNKFGYEQSEVLFTTDYIYDEEILNRINYLKENADLRNCITDESAFGYQLNGSSLIFNRRFESVTIYDISGKQIAAFCDVEAINLEDFKRGLYLAICKSNTITKTIKFVRR